MSEEKRKSKNWRLPEDLVEKLEVAFKEQNKCKTEQDFAAYLLGIGLDGRRKSDSYKNMGMALLPNWDPEMPCRECGRKIPLTLKILYKEGVGAVCPSCQKEIALEEMGDPATLSKQIIMEAQEKRIRQAAKILQVMYRAIYENGESIHLPEYASLLLEAAKNENEVHKVFLMLIQERNLVPDKEAARIYLEEAEKHKQCRISLERKRREIELKPITVGKIKEILQNVEYYVPVEVQPPQIEDQRSNEPGETISASPVESAQAEDNPSEKVDTLKFINDPDAAKKARDPTITDDRPIYCHDGGLRVFPQKCEECREKSFAKWDECQKQKKKKQSETEVVST